MTNFLAAVLAKALYLILEALITRLVREFVLINLRQRRQPTTVTVLAT